MDYSLSLKCKHTLVQLKLEKQRTQLVSNITEPLIADLLNAWLTDSVPLWLSFHLATINLKIIKQLVVNMTDNGMKEYRKASICKKIAL